MLVSDLPEDELCANVKIRIPKKYRKLVKDAGLKTMEVYFYSAWFSGIWVKTDQFNERVYPLQIMSAEVLDWEVIT